MKSLSFNTFIHLVLFLAMACMGGCRWTHHENEANPATSAPATSDPVPPDNGPVPLPGRVDPPPDHKDEGSLPNTPPPENAGNTDVEDTDPGRTADSPPHGKPGALLSLTAARQVPSSQIRVTASNTYGKNLPSNVIDGKTSTIWNSGLAPQWIQLDLGAAYEIAKIRLVVDQDPPGLTEHRVSGGEDENHLKPMSILKGTTQGGQVLEVSPSGAARHRVRYLRIDTVKVDAAKRPAPTWVGWREIQVFFIPLAVSGSAAGSDPFNAIDGNPGTVWFAGGKEPHSLQIDLGSKYDVSKIRLLPYQAGGDNVSIRILGGETADHLLPIGSLEGTAKTGDRLELIPEGTAGQDLRLIEILTSGDGLEEVAIDGGVPATGSGCIDQDHKNANLKYFGYFGSAFYEDHTAEIKDHANVTWIEDGLNTQFIEAAQTQGSNMKILLYVIGPFFGGEGYSLYPDYRSRWEAYAEKIRPYADSLIAFYPLDEPNTFIAQTRLDQEVRRKAYVSWTDEQKKKRLAEVKKEVRDDLKKVGDLIHSTFPGKPVAVTLGVDNNWVDDVKLFSGVFDWIGFDCYGSFGDCSGNPIPWYLQTLDGQLTSGQRIFLIADASLSGIPSDQLSDIDQNELVGRAGQYYELANSSPKVVGLFPFVWQSFSTYTGVRDMELVRYTYNRIGDCIIE